MRPAQRYMLATLAVLSTSAWSATDLSAVTERYCTKCHNTEDWAGGLDLTSIDHGHVGEAAAEWEKVALKLRAGMMPPPGEKRPSRQETEAFVRALEQRLDAAEGTPAPAPALHRLNRTEFTNAVRDIFGLQTDISGMLPPDDASEGFDNVAAGLGISPALIQGYTNAAIKLARLAVGDMTTGDTSVIYQASGKQGQSTRLAGLPLGSRGGMRVEHYFPLDAEYRISVGAGGGFGNFNPGNGGNFNPGNRGNGGGRGNAGNGGNRANAPDGPGNLGAGNRGGIPGNAGNAGNAGNFNQGDANQGNFNPSNFGAGNFAGGNFAGGGAGSGMDVALDGQRIDTRNMVRVKAGSHELTVAMFDQRRAAGVNDIYSAPRTPGGIDQIEITGPFNATGPGETESRRRIFSCYPRSPGEERACAQRIISDIATRAFRGPQRTADLEVITQFYERGHAEGGFETGIQQALSRILIDPRFLFRIDESGGGSRTISDLALASRLSFFLWSSIPDQTLIDLGVAGKLHRPEVLAAQVRRMLADPRGQALVDNFAGQWLYLRELKTVTPEVEGFDESLRDAFIGETRELVRWVLAQDRPVTELLTADYTFLNERLAQHYGIDGVRGPQMRMVKLPAGLHRRGVLGHGSILTVTSTATRTSPVIRGAWILGTLLGAPPPNPPDGVETNIDGDGTKIITTSVRERLEQHRQNPSCASCHGVIDPVGFALEHFNAIGAWRERDGDTKVDSRGTLVDGTVVNGTEDLVAALMSQSQLFVNNVTQKLMTYALGRALDHRDMPAVRAIVKQAERQDLRLSALVLGVVQSPAFRQGAYAPEPASVAAR
jgi:hypothetical protein